MVSELYSQARRERKILFAFHGTFFIPQQTLHKEPLVEKDRQYVYEPLSFGLTEKGEPNAEAVARIKRALVFIEKEAAATFFVAGGCGYLAQKTGVYCLAAASENHLKKTPHGKVRSSIGAVTLTRIPSMRCSRFGVTSCSAGPCHAE